MALLCLHLEAVIPFSLSLCPAFFFGNNGPGNTSNQRCRHLLCLLKNQDPIFQSTKKICTQFFSIIFFLCFRKFFFKKHIFNHKSMFSPSNNCKHGKLDFTFLKISSIYHNFFCNNNNFCCLLIANDS